MAKVRESKIEKECGEIVKNLGGMFIKISHSSNGLPDRLILMPDGKHFFVEFKAPKGKTSPLQDHFISWLNSNSHEAFVCDSISKFRGFLSSY